MHPCSLAVYHLCEFYLFIFNGAMSDVLLCGFVMMSAKYIDF